MAWSNRRRVFLIEHVAFLACLVIGLVLVFNVSAVSGKVIVALCLAVVMGLHGFLQLTYFRGVLPDLRKERQRHRSNGGSFRA